MEKIKILILAAGKGTRMMQSDLPKVLIPLSGKPMIKYLLDAIKASQVDEKPTIVVGYKKEMVMSELGTNYDYVNQEEQLGTGHAVQTAYPTLKDKAENIMVLPSDHPFITSKTINKLAEKHLESKSKITMATVKLPNFEYWGSFFYKSFSRIVRNEKGEIAKDVQFKDASEEERKITEVNPIYFCFETKWLWEKIATLKTDNAQKEYYLTDLVQIAIREGEKISTIDIEPREGLAANSKEELALLETFIK